LPGPVDEGRAQEDRAADWLSEAGYTIVTRRFRSRRGEIDLVALEGDLLVFVEVKSSATHGYEPELAVGEAKRKALVRAGQAYLEYIEEPDRPVRYDLIAIDRLGFRHYKDVLNED